MFTRKNVQKLAKTLNVSEREADRLIARLQGWISKHGTSTNSLAKGLNTILSDIAQKPIKTKVIEFEGIKNPTLIKHGKLILQLHREGMGYRRISEYLRIKHNCKISYSTVGNFIKSQERG